MKRIYKIVFGIEVCDVVRTSYGTGPYEVDLISGPTIYTRFPGELFVHLPEISVVGHGIRDYAHVDHGILNGITLERDGRYLMHGSDELFLEKVADRPALPMDLFESYPPIPEPYQFQEGVDYTRNGAVWKCEKCHLDFNMEDARYKLRLCPRCGSSLTMALHIDSNLLLKGGEESSDDNPESLGLDRRGQA